MSLHTNKESPERLKSGSSNLSKTMSSITHDARLDLYCVSLFIPKISCTEAISPDCRYAIVLILVSWSAIALILDITRSAVIHGASALSGIRAWSCCTLSIFSRGGMILSGTWMSDLLVSTTSLFARSLRDGQDLKGLFAESRSTMPTSTNALQADINIFWLCFPKKDPSSWKFFFWNIFCI